MSNAPRQMPPALWGLQAVVAVQRSIGHVASLLMEKHITAEQRFACITSVGYREQRHSAAAAAQDNGARWIPPQYIRAEATAR